MTAGARVYAMPELGRYGLTHGLLAWARCRLWCEQTGAVMVAPFWFKLRIGPWLRNERDKRTYFLLFQPGAAMSGIRRLALLATAGRREIGPEWPEPPPPSDRPVLLRFHNALQQNEVKSFHQIRGHGAFIRRELVAITRPAFRPPPPAEPFIAIHVRLGDFSRPASAEALTKGASNSRLPIDWYADRLTALRSRLGREVPAVVFSDGEDAELQPLLALPGVIRPPRQSAITDLLQMGQGICVISSGSGFSLWGAFLGDAARLCFPGQLIVPALTDPQAEIESDFGADLPEPFIAAVARAAA